MVIFDSSELLILYQIMCKGLRKKGNFKACLGQFFQKIKTFKTNASESKPYRKQKTGLKIGKNVQVDHYLNLSKTLRN